ncbi:hotdog family protein [Glaciimonas sp. PCH181]|uniref:ApeP family dehydratase n=1 Tax=Glaciimonas sp. PCH181 TaxID=2133943 RepID=UPI000D3346FF|nr:hotdog family protein [Glaciimonas sp. PCH181]PUA19786.1 3-hydroxylacyl-ACP dehydratase [Glaciimonas sp. PCH181]
MMTNSRIPPVAGILPDIRSLLPHSGVMVLLDRVIAVDQESLCAEVTIRPDSLFMGSDGVGSWVGVEYMAQAIAAFAGYNARLQDEAVKMGFLLGTRRYEAHCDRFVSGSVLMVKVQRVLQADNGIGSFECWIESIDGASTKAQPLALATITVFQPPDVHVFLEGKLG